MSGRVPVSQQNASGRKPVAVSPAPRDAALGQRVNPVEGMSAAHADLLSFFSNPHGAYFEMAMRYVDSLGIKRDHFSYAVLGLTAFYLIFGSAARLFCNLIGFGYPMYASVKAIRSKEKEDDTVWLIYWTCFAVLCLVDFFSESIFSIFPFYYIVKAAFLVYLYLPQTRGSAYFYTMYVDPLVVLIDTTLTKFNKKE